MRKDKHIAFELRKQGKSYTDIQKELGISRGTLCDWFKDIEWSKHIKHKNSKIVFSVSKERIEKLNLARSKKLSAFYENAEKEAVEEFQSFKKEPLFIGGLMSYAGEGDKKNKNQIRITNSEFYIIKVFVCFCEKYLNLQRENIKCGLVLYSDNAINDCIVKWSDELRIQKSNFYKTQIIKGKEKTKRLQFGIGMIIIPNTFLKKKLMKWLGLYRAEVDAGMV